MSSVYVPREYIENDDLKGLKKLMSQWENPGTKVLEELLEQFLGKPHTTAFLLEYLNKENANNIDSLHLFDDDLDVFDLYENQSTDVFETVRTDGGLRITGYKGEDRDVVIPEIIDGMPVLSVSELFFLDSEKIDSLMVPENIKIHEIVPSEVRGLFGRKINDTAVYRIAKSQIGSDSTAQKKDDTTSKETSAVDDLINAADIAKNLILSEKAEQISLLKTGDSLELGSYAFDMNGQTYPLSWIVVDELEDKLLIVCKYVIERLPFNLTRIAKLWDGCDLREWLNSYFLEAAFSESEKSIILNRDVIGEKNPVFSRAMSEVTKDSIFILSGSQWNAYEEEIADCIEETPWSYFNAEFAIEDSFTPVWIRMAGLNAQHCAFVEAKGKVSYEGRLVSEPNIGVLPAMWIKKIKSN